MLQIFILQIVYSLKLFPLFWKLNKITTTESAFLHVKTVQIFTTHRGDKLTFDLSLTFPVYSFFLKWSCCFINICWIKNFWTVLFIFLIKCCIFIGYEFTYLQNWLTKSIENWLTSKNITLLRSNVNLLSFVVQVQGQDCAVRHEDTYWCPWSSNAVPFLLPMSHTITDSS